MGRALLPQGHVGKSLVDCGRPYPPARACEQRPRARPSCAEALSRRKATPHGQNPPPLPAGPRLQGHVGKSLRDSGRPYPPARAGLQGPKRVALFSRRLRGGVCLASLPTWTSLSPRPPAAITRVGCVYAYAASWPHAGRPVKWTRSSGEVLRGGGNGITAMLDILLLKAVSGNKRKHVRARVCGNFAQER